MLGPEDKWTAGSKAASFHIPHLVVDLAVDKEIILDLELLVRSTVVWPANQLWPDGALHIGNESGFASEDSRTPGFLVIPQLLLLSRHLFLKAKLCSMLNLRQCD